MAVKKDNKGFSLMEMIIVAGIIAVLVVIAIPIFHGELTNVQKTADIAAIDAAYTKAMLDFFDNKEKGEAISDPLRSDEQMIDFLNKEQPIYTEKGRRVKVTVYPEGKIQWELY